ncbi:MAG: bifunctional demethylmenaquinone methyltransferase/2-methoxy-6-polyprenyl-1,4-benzoquinol methylase UbiE [Paludibacter sp.]|nr:bifunctional demethylmenaquinone methyltransferase/2-methoxy-6-polyprenyl-1,4-benzoquinol methylase UbiE [Paludibacter sp.]
MDNREVVNDKVKPYKKQDSKTNQLREMFNTISKDYDFFNNLMSWGLAHTWRKKAILWLKGSDNSVLLDVATGTADILILAEKYLQPQQIYGIDISEEMLKIGRTKLEEHHLSEKTVLEVQDCANLQFKDGSFDTVTIAFGLRNLEKLSHSVEEINRVLKTGGKFLIVEVNEPQRGVLAFFYKIYVRMYVLFAARLLSDDKDAYKYLTQSMHFFPQGKALTEILTPLGFKLEKYKSFTLGVCSAYLFEKTN